MLIFTGMSFGVEAILLTKDVDQTLSTMCHIS